MFLASQDGRGESKREECYCCQDISYILDDGIICGESSRPSFTNAEPRLVRSVRNAHGHPNIWPQACEAPIQHQSH
jgi:hypothetical protein